MNFIIYVQTVQRKSRARRNNAICDCNVFEKEMSYTVERPMNREEVEALLYELMPSKNLFYGIRMDGTFREVRTRTVPRQENRIHRSLK